MNSLSVKLALPTRVQPEVYPKPGQAGVYTNQLHYFKKHVLDELSKKKFASDFMNPVDTEELQIPHYYTVINRPMDVGTITKRVENNYYRDVEEAISDFRLLIRNCYNFNRPENVVYRKGIQLEKFFLRAIKNIPKGVPVPCNKDPMAGSKQKTNPMPGNLEQECRNQLRKLQTVTNQAEATARNFFGPKWNSFSAKLDKQFFKSLEEFRSQVEGMFNKYHEQAKAIYEQVYGKTGRYQENSSAPSSSSAAAATTSEGAEVVVETPYIKLTLAEAKDLLLTQRLTKNSLSQCLKQPQKLINLADTFCATLAQFEHGLEVIVSAVEAHEKGNGNNPEQNPTTSVKEKVVPAGSYLPTEGLEFLVDTPDAGLSEDDPKLEPIDQEERRKIQTLFCTLPAHAMREICGIVHANETLGRDENGGFTFDLNTFELANVQIMKAAVTRALKLNNKIKLRTQKQEEVRKEEDLACSLLESQLTDITERLERSSRKKSSEKKSKGSKKSGSSRRGKKRAPSPAQSEVGTAATGHPPKKRALPTFYIPSTPLRVVAKSGKSGKLKKTTTEIMGPPSTPRSLKSTFPLTPGARITRKPPVPLTPRIQLTPTRWGTVCRRTPLGINASKAAKGAKGTKGAKGSKGGRAKTPPAKPKPAEKPQEVKEKKKFKTLADSSTDEDEDNDNNDNKIEAEAPSTSKNPPSQKGKKSNAKKDKKKSKQKTQICLTPGNVLNADLSLSSSSSDEN